MSEQWPWITAVVVTLALIGGIVFFDSKSKNDANGGPIDPSVTTIADGEWVKGAADAPVTIIEYSDFQCPACRSYQPMVQELLSQRGDQIRFVYRHFPLSSHANAEEAARASEAAGKQGRFWEMHDKLFELQGEWATAGSADERFAGYASELGLNVDQFKSDYQSDEIDDAVDADRSSGNNADVNATPTFIVNGEKLAENPSSLDEFLAIVESKR